MIATDFLPRDNALYEITNPVELTESVDDLSLSYPDGWPDAYWYGWLRWENVPDSIKLSNVSCTGTGNDRTITATTINGQNLNVGYIATGYDNTALYWYGMLKGLQPYTENAGTYQDPVSNVSPLFGSRFINKLDPRGVCPIHGGASAPAENAICLFVQLQRIYGDDRDGYNNFSAMSLSFDDTEDGINKFLNGDITKTISFSNYAVYDNGGYEAGRYSFSYELDINSSDFGAEHPNVWTYRFSQSGYDFILSVFMLGFGYPVGADNVSQNTAYENKTLRISPIISQIMDGTTYYGVGAQNYTNYIAFDSINDLVYESNLSGVSVSETLKSIDDYVYGGFNGSITLDNNGKNNYGIMFNNSANFSVCIERSGQDITKTRVLRIMSVEEMQHAATLNMRYVTNDSYLDASYGFGSGCYYPHISPENEYLCEWLTGDFDDIKDDLRPWQYGDIIDNEYNPGDLPPYIPDEDEPIPIPTEDKFTGDPTDNSFSRLFSAKGVQYYALNDTLLNNFIQRLWSQPKSFYDAIQIAGKQTNSIFDYIESLRYYPLNHHFGTTQVEPVHFGTGATLLDIDNETAVQLAVADSQPRGLLIGGFVLSDSKYHWRNNFLDYAPYTKISLYLPYVGTIELDSATIASNGPISSATINILVQLDITTGCLTYYVINGSDVLLAEKTTKIAIDLPLSGNDSIQQSVAILRAQFNTTKQILGSSLAPIASLAQGNPVGALQSVGNLYSTIGSAYLENSLAKKQVPVEIQSQGGVASNIFRAQIPYLTIHRQKYSNPNNYGHTIGFLAEETYTIKSLNGFTTCRNPDLSGISSATDKELKAIKDLLESGFYA